MPNNDLLKREIFNLLCRKYIQRSDERQKELGLQYTNAETHDLTKTIVEFIENREQVK